MASELIQNKMKLGERGKRSDIGVYLIFLITGICLFISGVVFLKRDEANWKQQALNELKTKAEFIAEKVETWRKEKYDFAYDVSQSLLLNHELKKALNNGNDHIRWKEIELGLQAIVKGDQECDIISIVDKHGHILTSTVKNIPEIIINRHTIERALLLNRTILGNLKKDITNNEVGFDVVSPLLTVNKSSEFLIIFRFNPKVRLYPILSTWPSENKTEELLLFEQSGDSVLFLSDLKFVSNAAVSFKLPLSQNNNPAVLSILKGDGFYHRQGYHGKDILEYIQKIKDSPWFLASKIDEEELIQPIRKRVLNRSLILSSVFIFLSLALFLVLNLRKRLYYKSLLKEQHERLALKNHYEYASQYANDIILLEDENLNIIDANLRAVETYQCSLPELQKMKLKDLFAPEEIPNFDDYKQKITNTNGSIFESLHQRKNGSQFHVEISARTITIDNKQYFHQVIRDISLRKKAEIELIESEERFRTTLYSTGDAIITTDVLGNVINMNRIAEKFTGWTEKEAEGQSIHTVFPVFNMETHEEAENPVDKVLTTKKIVSLANHTLLRSKNGRETPIGDSGAPIRNAKGEITGVVLVFRDETLRIMAKKALEQSELHFSSLANNAPVGIFRTRADGYTTYVNPHWCKLSGLTQEESVGDGWLKAVHPDDREKLESEWRQLSQQGSTSLAEYRFLHPDGKIVYVYGQAMPEFNTENEITGYIGTISDITERKENEKELRLFRTLIDRSNDTFVVIDPDTGKFLDASDISHLNLGYTREQLMEITLFDLYPNASLGELREINNLLKTQDHIVWEGTHQRKNGSTFPIEVNIQQASLEKDYLIAVVRDVSARKKSEEALVQSEKKYHEIFELAPVGIYQSNPDGSLITANIHMADILGYDSVEELMARNMKTNIYFHQEERDLLIREHEPTGSVHQLEVLWKKKDGSPVWVWLSVHAIKDENNQTLYFEGFVQDITKQKEAEQELRLLSRSVEQNPTNIVITNANGIIEYVNPQFTNITGYSSAETIGKNPSILKSGYQKEEFYQDLWKTILSGNIWSGELLNKKKNGELYWEKAIISPVTNNKGTITHFVSVKEDISERKRMEAIQEVLVNISNAVLTTENLEKFLAYLFEQLGKLTSTQNFFIAVYDEVNQLAHIPFQTDEHNYPAKYPVEKTLTGYVIQQRRPVYIDKNEYMHLVNQGIITNMKTSALGWMGVPLFNDESIIGVLVLQYYKGEKELRNDDLKLLEAVAPQISLAFERKKVIEDLKMALDRAQESERLKSAFLATMSHELRTPLNAVIGFSDLINDEMSMDEIISFNQMINNSGKSLLEIIEGILDLTMLESGQFVVKKSGFSLSHLMDELLTGICNERDLRKKNSIHIIKTLGPLPGDTVVTDKDKIHKVLNHLLKNALKFTKEGEIEFGCNLEKENTLRFFVRDTGIGIPENDKDVIFERFRQVEDGYTRRYGGTGIGLSVSKQIVKLLGGEINFDSKPGEGSEFYFTIPYLINENKQKKEIASQESKPITLPQNRTILVVEDNELNYELICKMLESENLIIKKASTGKEAVNYCKTNNEIELVLMDIGLPEMNGIEATKIIKLHRPRLPIIAVTAFALHKEQQKITEAGCDAYIEKPVSKNILLKLLKEFLN